MLFVVMSLLSVFIISYEIDNNNIVKKQSIMGEESPLVKGIIVFEDNIKPFTGATIYIRLLDVSLQDAPSKLIAEQVIKNASYSNDQKIEFAIYGNITNNYARHSINIHVDTDNNGKISKGDFITMQSYPVITFNYPNNIEVNVKEIK
jgi:uncharacterized lipoprotein YbaY